MKMNKSSVDVVTQRGSIDDVVEALYFLGAIAECEGRPEEAISSYERAVELAPYDVMAIQALKLLKEPTMH